jgi:hypothetical protein
MYQLLTNKHPLLTGNKEEDKKPMYIKRVKTYEQFSFPSHVSSLAQHLIINMCKPEVSKRTSVGIALYKHPWITRRLSDELPLSREEKDVNIFDELQKEGQLRKAINVLMMCALTGLNRKVGKLFPD